jgi:hypothetical protein
MDSSAAARSVIDLLGVLLLPVFVCFFGIFVWGSLWSDRSDYSLADNALVAFKVAGIIAALCLSVLINAKASELAIVVESHPLWGGYTIVLMIATILAVVWNYLTERKEDARNIDLLIADGTGTKENTSSKSILLISGSVLAGWVISILSLWRIGIR